MLSDTLYCDWNRFSLHYRGVVMPLLFGGPSNQNHFRPFLFHIFWGPKPCFYCNLRQILGRLGPPGPHGKTTRLHYIWFWEEKFLELIKLLYFHKINPYMIFLNFFIEIALIVAKISTIAHYAKVIIVMSTRWLLLF